jgi:hypothetical protein
MKRRSSGACMMRKRFWCGQLGWEGVREAQPDIDCSRTPIAPVWESAREGL